MLRYIEKWRKECILKSTGKLSSKERGIIHVHNAYENNLKNIDIDIPKHKITIFTGVSGSGKTSIVLDTVAAQSRRELNETFSAYVQHYLPKYGRPHVGNIENLPVAIVIDQKKPASNQRSTVGTYTDIYTLLRLLFSRVGKPFIGYSDVFSFNHPKGSCPMCDGIGEITELDIHKLVDFDKCLNDTGVINYIAFEPGQWRWIRYAYSGLFDLDKKIRDYSEDELELFLYSPQIKLKNPMPGWPKSAKYEGLVHRMYRSVLNSEEGRRHRQILDPMTHRGLCPECGGMRLNASVRSCRINGFNIAEVSAMSFADLVEWLDSIEAVAAEDIKRVLKVKIQALIDIGLEYLTLDRKLGTLSGGEAQRCKIAKYLNSSLTDLLYILDEPSVGLHSHDIHKLVSAIKKLRDAGNTVLMVEHHKEVICEADYIIDMGPGPGNRGGEVMYEGSYEGFLESDTKNGSLIRKSMAFKEKPRNPSGWYEIIHADLHNLKDVSIRIPKGILTVIAGVAGSGKSSLMDVLTEKYPEIEYVTQKNIGTNSRSTPATYIGAADEIRKIFSLKCGADASKFSFNGKGKCPVCGGKGIIVSKMAFMDSIETVCEACGGARYSQEALEYKVDGMNIAQVMDMTVETAEEWFEGTKVADMLHPLSMVGLSYLHLNQSLSTLSGGELQRMKLASYLGNKGDTFIFDEPTDGLHTGDIKNLVHLFDNMVEAGNTILIIEHNLDVIRSADYVIEMGPGGGSRGGHVLFSGTPVDIKKCKNSVTGLYL